MDGQAIHTLARPVYISSTMSKLNTDLLKSSIDSLLKFSAGGEISNKGEDCKGKVRKFTESIELQVTLKNYDSNRDKRFSGTFRLPVVPRPNLSVCVLGNAKHCEKAEQIGLINRAVIADDLTEQTMALAAKMASKSSMTLAVGKRAFYQQATMPLDDAYSYTSQVMVDNMLAHDAEEGIGAFVEKRVPVWQDK